MGFYFRQNGVVPVKTNKLHYTTDFAKFSYRDNRKVIDVLKNNMWKNQPCYLIGGGPSLENFDFSLLEGKKTIGINKSFMYYEADIQYFMDMRFLNWIKEGLLDKFHEQNVKAKWDGLKSVKIILQPMNYVVFKEPLYVIRRLKTERFPLDLGIGIFSGDNSGFGAIQLAMCLGANPIYLLGYDADCDKVSHFHGGYPGQAIDTFKNKLGKYAETFAQYSEPIRKLGFNIINLNPDSKIMCFKKEPLNSILKVKSNK